MVFNNLVGGRAVLYGDKFVIADVQIKQLSLTWHKSKKDTLVLNLHNVYIDIRPNYYVFGLNMSPGLIKQAKLHNF